MAAEIFESRVDFPAFGKPTRPNVGQELEIEPKPALFSSLSGIGVSRGAVRVREIALVAAAPPASLGDHQLFAVANHLAHHDVRSFFSNDGSQGNIDAGIRGIAPGAIAGASVPAALGPEFGVKPKREKRVLIHLTHQNHIAARPARAAVRAAHGDEGLTPEARATASAITTLDENLDAVDKHYRSLDPRRPASPRMRVERRLGKRSGLARNDTDEFAASAVIFEKDMTAHLGEHAVVFGETGILSGLEAGALLTDDDASARHEFASEGLDAEAL